MDMGEAKTVSHCGYLYVSGFVGIPGTGEARADISIGISPPSLVISGPPEVAVIPGTYVYFVPDAEADLFFYGGYWYRPPEGRWFRASGQYPRIPPRESAGRMDREEITNQVAG